MKAIILAAGHGRRLLPLTHTTPKSLIAVGGKTILEWQIAALARNKISDITLVTGFAAEQMDVAANILSHRYGVEIKTLYNPFYGVSDNIASCWAARDLFNDKVVLMNGDTLFGADLLAGLLENASAPVNLAFDQKDKYDADDIKLIMSDRKIERIGKTLNSANVSAEAVGLYLLQDHGTKNFVRCVDAIMQRPRGVVRWYYAALDELAAQNQVMGVSIEGHPWAEVDYPNDIIRAERITPGLRLVQDQMALAS